MPHRLVVGVLVIAGLCLGSESLLAQSQTDKPAKVAEIAVYFSVQQAAVNEPRHTFFVADADAILATWAAYLDGVAPSKRLWFNVYDEKGTAAGDVVINLENVNMITFASQGAR